MAIKSNPFGRTMLSGKEAVQFIVQMNEDKANPIAKENLKEGKKLRANMREWQVTQTNK